ncbi:MAG TPA: hypothetical protein VFR35_07890 [Actinoplanes sp.]|nr:hypothetical protein [Actinoplanes sp.]
MILDTVAEMVRRFLGMFSADTAEVLFLPVFAVAVMVGFVLAVHKLAPPLSRLAAVVLTWMITGAGAFVLLAEMVVADGYRRRGVRPPSAVYHLGDVVASWAVGLTAVVRQLTAALAGLLSRAKVPVLVLLSIGWIWLWNYQHCPDGAAKCDRPVSAWYQQVSDGRR